MNEKQRSKLIFSAVLVVAILLSRFLVASTLSNPDTYAGTIAALEEKQSTVLELTAATTAASAAITLLPGDTATPIADKLADVSAGFLIVLCAIYLEKYLLTIIGYTAFAWLIPLALSLLLVDAFVDWDALKKLGSKLFVFALLISLVIPSSVQISNLIDATYHASIESTLEDARDTTAEIEESTDAKPGEPKKNTFSDIVSKVTGGITDFTTGLYRKVVDGANRFLEALAVMLVTSCLIPMLVLLVFVWLINITFSANLTFSYRGMLQWRRRHFSRRR